MSSKPSRLKTVALRQPEGGDDEGATYRAPGATNCKGKPERSERERINRRARRERLRLLRGMEGRQCMFITLTQSRCLDLTLRSHGWHHVLTRLKQRWPEMAAWAVIEYGSKKRGVHLHAIVTGTPGITQEWLDHVCDLLGDGTQAHLEPVPDPAGMADYLAKDLFAEAFVGQWPRYFRPVTVTRNWCPGWLNRVQWREQHRRAEEDEAASSRRGVVIPLPRTKRSSAVAVAAARPAP